MEENKRLLVQKLFDTLKVCRAFQDIDDMTYVDTPNGEKCVITITKPLCNVNTRQFENVTFRKEVNVTADSCMAMIQDIWKFLYDYYA